MAGNDSNADARARIERFIAAVRPKLERFVAVATAHAAGICQTVAGGCSFDIHPGRLVTRRTHQLPLQPLAKERGSVSCVRPPCPAPVNT